MDAASNSAKSQIRRTQTRILALMVALSAMSYFDRTISSIAGPGIMKEFNISATQMGSVFSAFLLTYMLCMIPGGGLCDRYGARRVLGIAGFGTAVFTGLIAFCGRHSLGPFVGILTSFVAAHAALGAASAPVYPACGKVALNWFSSTNQGRVQALIQAGAAIGAATSPMLFSWLIAHYGWRVSFGIAAVFTALLFSFWSWYVRDYPSQHPAIGQQAAIALLSTAGGVAEPKRSSIQWGRLLADKNLMLLTFGYFMLNYFEYIFFYWVYYYFGEVLHVEARQSALATTALFITMGIMSPLGGWLSDLCVVKYGQGGGRRVVPIIAMTVSAILLYVGAASMGFLVKVLLLSLALGFATAAEGPFWAVTVEISGSQAGTAGAVLNTGGNLGGMLAPILTPLIAAKYGWTGGLYFGSLMVLPGVVAWFFIEPNSAIRDFSELDVTGGV